MPQTMFGELQMHRCVVEPAVPPPRDPASHKQQQVRRRLRPIPVDACKSAWMDPEWPSRVRLNADLRAKRAALGQSPAACRVTGSRRSARRACITTSPLVGVVAALRWPWSGASPGEEVPEQLVVSNHLRSGSSETTNTFGRPARGATAPSRSSRHEVGQRAVHASSTDVRRSSC